MPEFSEEYVKQLREEAAKWRTKVRELEADQHQVQVTAELTKRGIQADPGWVTMEEGQNIGEAVDAFIAKYPSLTPKKVEDEPLFNLDEPKPRVTPKPMSPSSPATTVPKPAGTNRITSRNVDEIRKDPQARAKVRSLYRELLGRGSNQGE